MDKLRILVIIAVIFLVLGKKGNAFAGDQPKLTFGLEINNREKLIKNGTPKESAGDLEGVIFKFNLENPRLNAKIAIEIRSEKGRLNIYDPFLFETFIGVLDFFEPPRYPIGNTEEWYYRAENSKAMEYGMNFKFNPQSLPKKIVLEWYVTRGDLDRLIRFYFIEGYEGTHPVFRDVEVSVIASTDGYFERLPLPLPEICFSGWR